MPATPKLNITRSISQGDLNPVGMIVQSMLTEAQFQALNGSSWVLMDGRNVAGSTYATVTGSSTIPDARGMVLRGKNNGRSDGNQNPAGDSSLGVYQADAFGSHNHGGGNHQHIHQGWRYVGTPGGGNQAKSRENFPNDGNDYGGNASGNIINTEGQAETRMRNITVNHFIKIN